MLKYSIKLFVLSVVLIASILFLITIGNREAMMEFVFLIALVASIFNTIFIIILEKAKITNFRNRSILMSAIEISIYFLLIILIEKIIKWSDLSVRNNFLLDFPFTYIYPLIILFIIFSIYKGK